MADGVEWPAYYTTDLLLYTYNYTCLKNAQGDYCFPDFYDINNDTDAGGSADACATCNLLVWQTQLDSAFGYDDELSSAYSALTSSWVQPILSFRPGHCLGNDLRTVAE